VLIGARPKQWPGTIANSQVVRNPARRRSLLVLQRLVPLEAAIVAALAWCRLAATCPLPDFRDGASALAHAQRAQQLANENPAEYQALLAAAYAEAGDFTSAVECQSRCLELSPPQALPPMRARLTLYESQQPFRDAL